MKIMKQYDLKKNSPIRKGKFLSLLCVMSVSFINQGDAEVKVGVTVIEQGFIANGGSGPGGNAQMSSAGDKILGNTTENGFFESGQYFIYPGAHDVWSSDTGVTTNFMGSFPDGYSNASALAMSDDGFVFAGDFRRSTNQGSHFSGSVDSFVWTEVDGFKVIDLGIRPDVNSQTRVLTISGDGNYVFGVNVATASITEAEAVGAFGDSSEEYGRALFRYNIETAEVDYYLGQRGESGSHSSSLPAAPSVIEGDDLNAFASVEFIYSNDSNYDGSVVVGSYFIENQSSTEKAWYFSDSVGFETLESPDDFFEYVVEDSDYGIVNTRADAVSADGSVIVGSSNAYIDAGSDHLFTKIAVRWAGDDLSLETLWEGSAVGVNSDGSVIIGNRLERIGSEFEDNSQDYEAVRYTDASGAQTISEWLTSTGVSVGELEYNYAVSVSDDGNTILVGSFEGANAIARAGAGSIDLNSEIIESLAGGFSAFTAVRALPALTVNGAHHRTLMDSAIRSEGLYTWATGDLARYNELDAEQAQGEIGASSDFGIKNFRAGLAVGYSDLSQELTLGGDSDVEGSFVLAEVDYQFEEMPIVLSALGYYGSWDADIRRNYRNAGLIDSSSGETNIDSYSVRLRADWEAYQKEKLTLTPRIAYTLLHNAADGYKERGGGFAAVFSSQNDTQHELRIGLDADWQVSQKWALRAILESLYTWDDKTSLNGGVAGIAIFNEEAEDFSGFEARLGAEATYLIDVNQQISISIFGSTSDILPVLSGAVSYGIQF